MRNIKLETIVLESLDLDANALKGIAEKMKADWKAKTEADFDDKISKEIASSVQFSELTVFNLFLWLLWTMTDGRVATLRKA
jgi:hypothetical protein